MPTPGMPASPVPGPGGPQPAPAVPSAAPPQRPQSGAGMQTLLAFLAGAGLKEVVATIQKLMGAGKGGNPQAGTADPNRQHRGGMRIGATPSPGTTVAPQMMQQAGADPMKLLQLLMMLRGGAPQAGGPSA